jgi:hypothetical protein
MLRARSLYIASGLPPSATNVAVFPGRNVESGLLKQSELDPSRCYQ